MSRRAAALATRVLKSALFAASSSTAADASARRASILLATARSRSSTWPGVLLAEWWRKACMACWKCSCSAEAAADAVIISPGQEGKRGGVPREAMIDDLYYWRFTHNCHCQRRRCPVSQWNVYGEFPFAARRFGQVEPAQPEQALKPLGAAGGPAASQGPERSHFIYRHSQGCTKHRRTECKASQKGTKCCHCLNISTAAPTKNGFTESKLLLHTDKYQRARLSMVAVMYKPAPSRS